MTLHTAVQQRRSLTREESMEAVSNWLTQHQPSWHDLSPEDKQALFGFAMLWPIFEVRITGDDGTTASPDRIAREVGNLVNFSAGPALCAAYEYFVDRYFLADDARKRREALGVNRRFLIDIERGFVDPDPSDCQRLLAVLLVINRLRNNFFHGRKAQYGYQEQQGNFNHANKVLMEVVELWPR